VIRLALALAASAWAAAPARLSDSIIQVGLASRASRVSLRPEGEFSAVDLASGERRPLVRGKTVEASSDRQGRVSLGGVRFSGAVRLLPGRVEDSVYLGERRYRGNVILKPGGDATVTVVNELGIEEYLYGVLAREMSPDWPLEALKAQAVVARTWALNNLGKFADLGFDLSDDARSQIYSGLDGESERSRRAVRETSGEILLWRGRPLDAFFHSCCGGHTAPASAVWGGADPRPLRGVPDRYCSDSPYFQWSAFLSARAVAAALRGMGFDVPSVDSLTPGRRDGSGYLRDLRVRAGRRTLRLRASDLRNAMASVKSAQIWRIIRRKGGFELVGRGFGHGVGLCQWGARGLASRGRGYRDILEHYFPGAEVAVWER
jgi:stage II sporulation protein D